MTTQTTATAAAAQTINISKSRTVLCYFIHSSVSNSIHSRNAFPLAFFSGENGNVDCALCCANAKYEFLIVNCVLVKVRTEKNNIKPNKSIYNIVSIFSTRCFRMFEWFRKIYPAFSSSALTWRRTRKRWKTTEREKCEREGSEGKWENKIKHWSIEEKEKQRKQRIRLNGNTSECADSLCRRKALYVWKKMFVYVFSSVFHSVLIYFVRLKITVQYPQYIEMWIGVSAHQYQNNSMKMRYFHVLQNAKQQQTRTPKQ